MLRHLSILFFKIYVFWILIFDFQRILFSIHHWSKFEQISFSELISTFYYSFKLDLAAASALTILPFLFLLLQVFFKKRIFNFLFRFFVVFEFVLIGIIHSGEINAYTEWNHKLTSRVFMHLTNPDEVVRSADFSMTFWFFVYLIIELAFSWKLFRYLFPIQTFVELKNKFKLIVSYVLFFVFFNVIHVLFLRGGTQPIPININAAIFSKNAITNDLSINSMYYFVKSFLLYNRSGIDDLIPKIDKNEAELIVKNLYTYPKEHDQYFLKNKKPNIVFVVLESWVADAVGCLGSIKNATPNFDKIAKDGILFTNIYSTSHTSEIGNTSIFCGFPSIPEVSISMQPEKSRKLTAINQSLKPFGYQSGYLFSGDLKYGNIGGFFMDHKFDMIKDENDFPKNLKRGKLNYYDEDLYTYFIQEINQSKEPFLQCAFTGSTHSPYDFPRKIKNKFHGNEADFMNSIVYADKCIGEFIQKVKKQKWYKNTLFVFVADHGHASPNVPFAMVHEFYRIPLLFWGPVIKNEYKGRKIDKKGSQSDIPMTLLNQMNINTKNYTWGKDLMNPHSKDFAFHTVIGGYGWGTKTGNLIYQMNTKNTLDNTFPSNISKHEEKNAKAYLKMVYEYYKNL